MTYWRNNGGLPQQGYPISQVFEEKNADPPNGDGKIHQVQYFERARFEDHPENVTPYNILLGLLGKEQFRNRVGISFSTKIISTDKCQYFSQTGFNVCGKFLDYWNSNGGLAQQGYPLSDVFEETNLPPPAGDGKTHKVQYFERARFEEHLENVPAKQVLLGLLGAEQMKSKYNNKIMPSVTPTSSTTQTGSASVSPDAEEQAFLEQLNNFRTSHGRTPLKFDSNLYQSASWMARDMATNNYISHTDSSGRSAVARIRAFGYKGQWVGENIAGGFQFAKDNLLIWQSDDIHLQNLLGSNYTHAAAARYYFTPSLNRWYWVLDMGSN